MVADLNSPVSEPARMSHTDASDFEHPAAKAAYEEFLDAAGRKVGCPRCGYDLRRATRNVCAECGTALEVDERGVLTLPLEEPLRIFRGNPLVASLVGAPQAFYYAWFRAAELPQHIPADPPMGAVRMFALCCKALPLIVVSALAAFGVFGHGAEVASYFLYCCILLGMVVSELLVGSMLRSPDPFGIPAEYRAKDHNSPFLPVESRNPSRRAQAAASLLAAYASATVLLAPLAPIWFLCWIAAVGRTASGLHQGMRRSSGWLVAIFSGLVGLIIGVAAASLSPFL
jgi:hypothetical protein